MSVIIPNSRIRLMFNVPLTSNYENTYYFEDEEEQLLFFENHFQSIEYDEQYYTRKRRGWLRINDTYNRVYNANYLFFRNVSRQVDNVANPPYENKSYYAFIDDVVYINDHTCEVHYTIDVIQTYMFTWELHQCIVERESTRSDRLYEHRIDEGLPVGDYVYTDGGNISFSAAFSTGQSKPLWKNPKVIIAATVDNNYQDSTTPGVNITHQWNKVITGCNLLVKELGGGQTSDYALYWLNNLPGEKQSAILGIYIVGECVTNMLDGTTQPTGVLTADVPFSSNTVGNYTPRNKKLLTAPYKALAIFSSDGTSKIFDYSKFKVGEADTSLLFVLYLSLTAPIMGYLSPWNYNGEGQTTVSAIPMPTLPSCTWSNDTYKAWAALNTGYMVSSIAGSVVDAGIRVGAAIYTGGAVEASGLVSLESALHTEASLNNPWTNELSDAAVARTNAERYNVQSSTASGTVGDIQNIANNLLTMHNAKIAPDSFNGSAQNLASMNVEQYGYYHFSRTIREDYARVLDDYFTMFGYKVLVTKTPVLYNRSRFTYVKTLNFDIGGKIPSIHKRIICDVFNSGIRFWVDKEHIGDYTAINQPLIL